MSSFSRITIDNVGYDVEDSIARNVIQDMLTAGTNIVETLSLSKSSWNTSKIYVWRGDSSASVTKGHIYYYDGDNWVDCGVYAPEGEETVQSGSLSHAEGGETTSSGSYAHAEGRSTTASGEASHAEGRFSTASDIGTHAEGYSTTASYDYSHAEGYETVSSGEASHAEGRSSEATEDYSHAEGSFTEASGNSSHAEGFQTTSSGMYSHAEGRHSSASGMYSHSEGDYTVASGGASHAEGNLTVASGDLSHAEGNQAVASGDHSHAEGFQTTSSGVHSHAEGDNTEASGSCSHSEGGYTVASGDHSHAEGFHAIASGDVSHVSGRYTKATRKAQTVIGKYNKEDTKGTDGTEYGKYALIIGNGSDSSHRSNALTVDWDGDVECETINGIDITALNNDLSDVKDAFAKVVKSFTDISEYLEKKDAYITTSGTYTSYPGFDTYHIPLNSLDICFLSWITDFWSDFNTGSVFTVKKSDNTYERLTGYTKYGAFYSSGNSAIACGVANVTDLFFTVAQGNESGINVAINEPIVRLVNDVVTSKILDASNTIRTNYYVGSSKFNWFTSPYGAFFIKMKQGDKLIINKTLTGVIGVGFTVASDGTATNINEREYTASADCIFSVYDNTSVDGDFTFIPKDSIKIASKDIIGDAGKSSFDGLNGVAFGTSLTYLASVGNGYLTKLSELSGVTFDNQGIGSAYIYGDGGQYDILAKIKSYSGYSGKRVAILEGFVNDWHGNKTLGDYTDTTETSVCGCVRSAINYMLSQNANLTIFLILDHFGRNNSGIDCSSTATNGSGLTQYEFYEKIAKVAESLGIPVIKEYEVSQISENTPQYLTDNIHPTAKGAIQSAYAIWSQMKEYYPNQV